MHALGKIQKTIYGTSVVLFSFLTIFVFDVPKLVHAVEEAPASTEASETCSEEELKNLQVAIINCTGTPSCGTSSGGGIANPAALNVTLRYPTGLEGNETRLIAATREHIAENYPRSPFNTNPQYLEMIYRLSREAQINPFLIISIAQQENGWGSSGGNAVANNNYFGMLQQSRPEGNIYYSFPTVEDGIREYISRSTRHISNPQGSWAGVSNFYEFLAVHQSGVLAYPGEYPPGSRGATSTPQYLSYDAGMDIYISWDVTANGTRGVYNPLIYFQNATALINKLMDTTLSDVPQRTSATTAGFSNACGSNTPTVPGSGANGNVDTRGYAFPLAPQTKAVGGINGGHHDGTPAFDLFSTDSAAVYAIFAGSAERINQNVSGVPGCTSIQFRAADGYFYWYGHLKNPSIQVGQQVAAGTKIAEVADLSFGPRCYGGAPHLHIDRGCTINGVRQPGGSDECRDPEFIPFLRALYETLPDANTRTNL
jgi:hypothetical protein